MLALLIVNSAASQSIEEPLLAENEIVALSSVVASDAPEGIVVANDAEETAGFVILEESVAFGSDSPIIFEGEDRPSRDEVITYVVKEGDTLSEIAEQFGISLSTILWANEGVSAKRVRIGQKLVILPVSGTHHKVVEGDTISRIAKKYQVSATRILEFNNLESDLLKIGQKLIIPGGSKSSSGASSGAAQNNLPSYSGYFLRPAKGHNFGSLHGSNGVDIANACGITSIFAAASGVVEKASYGWNGGYGNMIIMRHNNGTKTAYAHLQDISVDYGQEVAQGELIASMGNTGQVRGVTGCHLHFEVRGAANPFAR